LVCSGAKQYGRPEAVNELTTTNGNGRWNEKQALQDVAEAKLVAGSGGKCHSG